MHWIDPDHLPKIVGTVDQFLVNRHGEDRKRNLKSTAARTTTIATLLVRVEVKS